MGKFREELRQEISTLSLAKVLIWVVLVVLGLLVGEGWGWAKDQWTAWNAKPLKAFESTATSCKPVKDLIASSREWVELRTAGSNGADSEWSRLTEHALLCADYSSEHTSGRARRPHEILEEIANTFGECFSYRPYPISQPSFVARKDGLSLCLSPFVIADRTNDYELVTPQNEHKTLVLCMGRRNLREDGAAKKIEVCSAGVLREVGFPEALITDWLASRKRGN